MTFFDKNVDTSGQKPFQLQHHAKGYFAKKHCVLVVETFLCIPRNKLHYSEYFLFCAVNKVFRVDNANIIF